MAVIDRKGIAVVLLAWVCAVLPGFAQESALESGQQPVVESAAMLSGHQSRVVTKGPIVIHEVKHDTGPLLREIAPLLPEYSMPSEHEIEDYPNPNHRWKAEYRAADPLLQKPEDSLAQASPNYLLEFDGLGSGDKFFCDCMPPDNDGAPGIDQYTQYLNTFYAVYDKSGDTLLGPLAGNSFWKGFGGPCETDDDGDPIIRFDAMAQRWVVSQFAIDSSPFYECVAVSQTSDATGAFYRYAFSFSDYPDYPKLSVWPDAYYLTFNNFNSSVTTYLGANACAVDRNAMLAGNAATIVCFQQDSSQFGELPADLDGPTPPATGTPNFVMELDPSGSANLDMFAFHVDFVTPTNSTFTGPTLIPVAPFTPLCPTEYRGRCVRQPTTGSDKLESLGDRLMYRLVYRNFGDHTVLLTTHSVEAAGARGGVRWYEIHNPETGPALYQSGTYEPDTQYRWMPAIAMDGNQDIAIGYTRSGTSAGQYPSLVYTGRTPVDPLGLLEAESTLKTGLGSQTGGGDRWGDYSSLTIDPVDDCTFWFTEEYLPQDGELNWNTAIGTFTFPGCNSSPGSPVVNLTPTSLMWGKIAVGTTSGTKSVTVQNSGNATLVFDTIATSGNFTLAPAAKKTACGSALLAGSSCVIKVTFTPTQTGVQTGTLQFTDNAANSPQTVNLTGTGK
jgi:Abnormal spindle-like microcephaly-assoc'd, ASPM-SPD-2-Hydin